MILRALAFLVMMAGAAWAVEPGEMLEDPVLEDRARALSKELRCLVCRNESIDESNAELARDLRVLVRERIAGGDTDDEAMAFIVDRYGEYVLLNPPVTGSNVILWVAGPVLLLAALGISGVYIRRRRDDDAPEALTSGEEARLAELLDD
ncbi:cytochrome c-type biogenesis protein CcmH [Rhodobacteraceae bacterium]|nr:cytochrome c-type biogenesis protein CcmH [Paracoccaceae bacterium]